MQLLLITYMWVQGILVAHHKDLILVIFPSVGSIFITGGSLSSGSETTVAGIIEKTKSIITVITIKTVEFFKSLPP